MADVPISEVDIYCSALERLITDCKMPAWEYHDLALMIKLVRARGRVLSSDQFYLEFVRKKYKWRSTLKRFR